MSQRIPGWLAPRSDNPDVARREYVLNWVLAGLTTIAFLLGMTALIASAVGAGPFFGASYALATIPLFVLAYWLGRRGRVQMASYLVLAVLLLILLASQYRAGLGHSTLIGLALAVVVAGVLRGFWAGVAVALVGTAGYVILGLWQQAGGLPAPLQPHQMLTLDGMAAAFGLLAIVGLVWLSDRLAMEALGQARVSEQQAQLYAQRLETIQGQLEQQVARRTEELTEFARELQTSLAEQQRLWDTVQRLSMPIIPVQEGVLVTPLIGPLDQARVAQLRDDLLATIEEQDAHFVILDITGVLAVDADVAYSLVQTARATRLLGAESVLVGVRPEVADAVVRLGLDLGSLTTQRDLQEGVRYALARTTPTEPPSWAGRHT
jgi:rsbT co-antagonist protein RsbR